MGIVDRMKQLTVRTTKAYLVEENRVLQLEIARLKREQRQLSVQAAAGFEVARRLQNQVQTTTQLNGELLNVLAENSVDPDVAVQLAQAAIECKGFVAVGVDAMQAAIAMMKDDTQGAYTQLVRPREKLITHDPR